jgi:hypothetical protein
MIEPNTEGVGAEAQRKLGIAKLEREISQLDRDTEGEHVH